MKIESKKIIKIAVNQIMINKKGFWFVCSSIVLSILVLLSVYTLYNCLDFDKYIGKFVGTDFTIASNEYFNMKYFENSKDVDIDMIKEIQNRYGYIKGGALYYYTEREICTIEDEKLNMQMEGLYNNVGQAYLDLYGADDFVIDNMSLYRGTIDYAELSTGNYIIYGVDTDDNGNVESADFNVGEMVNICVNGQNRTYKIMAIIKKESEINTVKYWSKLHTMYLPKEEYISITNDEKIMKYMFDVEKSEMNNMDIYLSSLFLNDDDMQYTSEKIYIDEFDGIQDMIRIVGSFLTAIVALIGIMNYVNLIITEINSRENELAIMEAIGMTNGQMSFMFLVEGLLYSVSSILLSLGIGTITSLVVLKYLLNSIWFFTYRFTLYPILIITPVVICISVVIPYIMFFVIKRKSIVERMKIVD